MELYQLNSFVNIARLGSLTRAAENMHISLSALSNQIKLLEDELGVSLFIRKPRGMALSNEGEKLLPHAMMAVNSAYEVRRQALSLRGEIIGKLAIGLNTDPTFLRVAQLSKAMAGIIGNVEVNYVISETTKTATMLRNREMHLGFIYGTLEDEDIMTLPIHTATVQMVVPKVLLESLDGVSWEELAELPWIWGSNNCPFHVEMKRKLGKNFPPRNITVVSDESVVKELVRSGQGACILRKEDTKELIESGLVNHYSSIDFEIPLSIAVIDSRKKEPLIEAAITLIQGIFVDKPQMSVV
ncbi:MAG: hypothetical protein C0603_04475 [Denitrovibrio sp.]|mgnify:CR=1 FL=1|nr:MAG: hypothetical protein C0603_04475 [Denitrovibrio sp.]